MEEAGLTSEVGRETSVPPPLVDLALARRLEAADASAQLEYARAHALLRPEEGATWTRVAGGCAVYAGVESPLTQAVAVGLDGEVGTGEMDELEDFFRSRGANAVVEVCPLADVSLRKILAARDYRLDELTDKLFLFLARGERTAHQSPPDGVYVRRAAPEEAERWARTVAGGFFEDAGEPPRPYLDIFRASFGMVSGVCFLAEVGGETAGGGLLKIADGTAALSTASVAPALRRRGVQTALLRARLAYATQRGCDLATITARPDTASHRNAQRQGFRIAYTRTKMVRGWR